METLGRLQTWKIEMEKNDKTPFEKFLKNMECLDLTPILALTEKKYKSARKRGITISNRFSMPKTQAQEQSLPPALQKARSVKYLNSRPPQQTNESEDKLTLEIFVSNIELDVCEPPEASQLTTIMPQTSSKYGTHIAPQSTPSNSTSESCAEQSLSLAQSEEVSPVDSVSVKHWACPLITTMPVGAASFDTRESCVEQSLSLVQSVVVSSVDSISVERQVCPLIALLPMEQFLPLPQSGEVSPMDSMNVKWRACPPIATMLVDDALFDSKDSCTKQSLSLALSEEVSSVDSVSVKHRTCPLIATLPVDDASFDTTKSCVEQSLSVVQSGEVFPVDSVSVKHRACTLIATLPVSAAFDTTESCVEQSLPVVQSGEVFPVDSVSVKHRACPLIVTLPVGAASFDMTESCVEQSLSVVHSEEVFPVDSMSVEHRACPLIVTLPVGTASFDTTESCMEQSLSLSQSGEVSPVGSVTVGYRVASHNTSSSSSEDEDSSLRCNGRPIKMTIDSFPIPKQCLGSIPNGGKECYEASDNKQHNVQPLLTLYLPGKEKSSTYSCGHSKPFGTEYKQTSMPQHHLHAPQHFAVRRTPCPGQAKSTEKCLKTYEKPKTQSYCRVHNQIPPYQSECGVGETTSTCRLHCSKTGSLENVSHVCNKMDLCKHASQFEGGSQPVYKNEAWVERPECSHRPQDYRHCTQPHARPHCSHAKQAHCCGHARCQTPFYWGADPEDYLPVKRSRTQKCDYWNILHVASDVQSQCLLHQAFWEAMSECHYMYEQAHRYQRCETWEPFNRRKRKQTFQVRDYADCTIQQDRYAFDTGSIY